MRTRDERRCAGNPRRADRRTAGSAAAHPGIHRRAAVPPSFAGASAIATLVIPAVALATGCAGGTPPGARLDVPPGTRPTLSVGAVSGAGYHNETSVAIDPVRHGGVIASWQIPATVARSSDGGATWKSVALPGTDRWELAGDPAVTYGPDGTAYALFIAFDRPDDYRFLGRAAHRNGIFVSRSPDGGHEWSDPAAVVEHSEEPGIPFEDKPMMAVDRFGDSPWHGHLYVAWTQFRKAASGIRFARSTDGGSTFSRPIEISDRAGSPQDTLGADEGTDLAVGPGGTVYVVWSDSTGLLLDRSHDGGRTFGTDVHIRRTGPIVFGVPGVARANGYPSLGLDPRTGRLYVTWVDRSAGEADVYLVTSSDRGYSWSEPIRVSGDPVGSGIDHFFAWTAVDPVTGLVATGYYRSGPGGGRSPRLRYMLAWSGDGGRTFTRAPWGATEFRPGGQFLGDYTGVDASSGVVYGAWTEVPGPHGAAPADTAAGGVRGGMHRTLVVVGKASFGG